MMLMGGMLHERGAISIYFVQGEMAFRFILLLTIVRPPGPVKKQDMFWKLPVAGRQNSRYRQHCSKIIGKNAAFLQHNQ